MGQYARLHILKEYGIDIGDDEPRKRSNLGMKYYCSCSRGFDTEKSRAQHQKDTKHEPSDRQKKQIN
jgi:hypothetical protein